jgi:hypothetical protein
MSTSDKKTIQYIPIENLEFDPQNPRLPATVVSKGEQAVLEWMLNDASIIEMMGSIGQQNYFPGEPLLVVPIKGKENFYTVIEGNRRLTAVKLLRNPDLAPNRKLAVHKVSEEAKYKPDVLPVLEFERRDEILSYLGYRHITGIKEWNPLEKAKYLRQLRASVQEPIQEQFRVLAKTIGSRADYVSRLLTGLALYIRIEEDDFYRIKGLDDATIDFSILTTALTYTNIIKFMGLSKNDDPSLSGLISPRLRELTQWIYQKDERGRTKLGESRNLKELSRIVENEAALTAFREGASINEASVLTESADYVFRGAISTSKANLETARNYMHRVHQPTITDLDNLKDIQSIAKDLRTLVQIKLDETDATN